VTIAVLNSSRASHRRSKSSSTTDQKKLFLGALSPAAPDAAHRSDDAVAAQSTLLAVFEISELFSSRAIRLHNRTNPTVDRTVTDAALTDALRATVGTPGGHVRAAQDHHLSAPTGVSGGRVHGGTG
jgi:hypothetical protein